ncbi:RNA polymerase sigma factor [Streptomyces sp. NPDC026665]|uniref:RNA polymerase sigma factor n=1 Tax=Streptomyces sp. NPDC026665 TaxID=3154798 RepID=UPI0033FCF062
MNPDQATRGLSGKESEYEAFFRAQFPRVVRYLLVLGASIQEATDAAQDGFVKLWSHWDQVRAPLAWVRRTAEREYVNSAVKQNRITTTDSDLALESLMPPAPDDSWGTAREGQEVGSVLAMLKQLPPAQRRVFALLMDGLKPREIALELDMREATVRSHIRHGRERLRHLLEGGSVSSRP